MLERSAREIAGGAPGESSQPVESVVHRRPISIGKLVAVAAVVFFLVFQLFPMLSDCPPVRQDTGGALVGFLLAAIKDVDPGTTCARSDVPAAALHRQQRAGHVPTISITVVVAAPVAYVVDKFVSQALG